MDKLLLLTEGAFFKIIDVEVKKEIELETYYKNLNCDCIDIVEPYGLDEEGRKKYCLIVDDEALFKKILRLIFSGRYCMEFWSITSLLLGKCC